MWGALIENVMEGVSDESGCCLSAAPFPDAFKKTFERFTEEGRQPSGYITAS